MTSSLTRLWPGLSVCALLAVSAAPALTGCDASSTDEATTEATATADLAYYRAGSIDPADSVAARLDRGIDLTDAQIALVTAELATREPGDLWRLAGALTPTLTDAQRAALDSVAVSGSGRGARGGRGRGGVRGDSTCAGSDSTHTHGDSTRFNVDWAAVRAAELEARNTVLGLTAEGAAALDSALATLRGDRTRTAANVVPEAVAALLDDTQEAIYLVHQELRAYLHLGHGGGGRGGRGGGGRGR